MKKGAMSPLPLSARLLLGGLAVLGCLLLVGNSSGTGVSAQGRAAGPVEYIGAGSCGASSCHGSVVAKGVQESRIQQTEYTTWIVRDRHAKAYEVLSNPVSVRIAAILELGKANEAPRCLACHSLAAHEQRRRTFDLGDGVSCELCHGPASNWLGPHISSTTDRAKDHARNVQSGLYDTRDLISRTQKCLTCHLGTKDKFVDHRLIAAGHPDLVFELDSFTAELPPHWKQPFDEDAWLRARSWTTGQAVQLRELMHRVSRRAGGEEREGKIAGAWPEYGELDCFACHHSLSRPQESWRLTQPGYFRERRVGNPPWNNSRFAVFRLMVHQVDRQTAQRLDGEMKKLADLMDDLVPNKQEVAASAGRVAQIADSLAQRFASMPYTRELTLSLMRNICADADRIAGQGERVAEQAAMALNSLYEAYAHNGGANQKVREAIDGLYEVLKQPSAYDPRRFASQMRSVNAALP